MSVEKNNGLSVVVNNNGHISFNADLTFGIEQKEEGDSSVHVADVVQSLVLEAIKSQVGSARLFPGGFRLVMTGCVSDVSNTNKESADATSDVEEDDKRTVVQEEDPEAEEVGETREETSNEEQEETSDES